MFMKIFYTTDGLDYSYEEYLWGDIIRGSKEVLQRMGIAVGAPFPGDPGANRKSVKTQDPRGFDCKLEVTNWGRFPYSATISHPGRDYSYTEEWRPYANGVMYRPCGYFWEDEYLGSADALTAAGLVSSEHFPGKPGMSAKQQTVYADGTTPKTHGQKNKNLARATGSMVIRKISKNRFTVSIAVPTEIAEKRRAELNAHRQAWEARMEALPRAPRIDLPLRQAMEAQAIRRRASLRLVWSRPKFVPAFNIPVVGPYAR